jgi:hypothetical protein
VLGWILDTVRQTLEVPPHRHAELTSIFADLSHARRVSFKRWQQVLGKLRFVSVAIPGSRGLLSTLQRAHNEANGNRVRINRLVHDCLDSFGRCSRPSHLPCRDRASMPHGPRRHQRHQSRHGRHLLWPGQDPLLLAAPIVGGDNTKTTKRV